MKEMGKESRNLEIILITYNRAKFLDCTLTALEASPFASYPITVLNNASTDSTLAVCDAHASKFPDFRVITNKINIGGNANILRAAEISSGRYTWILADDDRYDFSDCSDVIAMVNEGNVPLIHVGAHDDEAWRFGGRRDTPACLIAEGYNYFRFSSFLPCNIFRTADFQACIIDGYNNIANTYPHMPYLLGLYSANKEIYVARRQIVFAVLGNQSYSVKTFYSGWYNTSLLLKKKKDRFACFKSQYRQETGSRAVFLIPRMLMWFVIYGLESPFHKARTILGFPRFIFAFVTFMPFLLRQTIKKSLGKKRHVTC